MINTSKLFIIFKTKKKSHITLYKYILAMSLSAVSSPATSALRGMGSLTVSYINWLALDHPKNIFRAPRLENY
jgi:hypothetical protein